MDGLRKEPLNISVDLGEGSLALALVCLSAPLAWIVTLSYLTSTLLIQHRVTGALWHINNWNNFNVLKKRCQVTLTHLHLPWSLLTLMLQASVSSSLKVIWAAKPLLMHIQRVRVRETIEGNRPFFRPIHLLARMLKVACQPTVAVTSDGRKATWMTLLCKDLCSSETKHIHNGERVSWL